jgi:Do/DeqQ family serine protease
MIGILWMVPSFMAATTKSSPPSPPVLIPESSLPNTAAKELGNTFANIVEKVSPSVVVIHCIRESAPTQNLEDFTDPFDFFPFGPRSSPHRLPLPPREAPREPQESQGSGFIVRSDGYIYTNNHVIQGADKIKVKLKDGRTFDAQIVGIPDEKTDVAVVKINAKDLPFVEIGDSDAIRPGEWTLAIGAPFNLDYSVTVGVLSGKVRDRLGATFYEEYLQTQATINPGNSGGPLLDIDGKVIGINTLIKTRQGGSSFYNANVGFAIPIKLAQTVGNLLITKGRIDRPWLGVDIRTLSEAAEIKEYIKGVSDGVLVMAIRPDTPAYRSGLKPGDVIVGIDGTPIKEARDLQRKILEKQIGQMVKLELVRDGKTIVIEAKTGLQPSSQEMTSRNPTLPTEPHPGGSFGMTVEPLTRQLSEQYELPETQGLLVTEVEDDSPAARSGVVPGMVITEVDGKKVTTPQALKESLTRSSSKKASLLQVSKGGIKTFILLKGPDRD